MYPQETAIWISRRTFTAEAVETLRSAFTAHTDFPADINTQYPIAKLPSVSLGVGVYPALTSGTWSGVIGLDFAWPPSGVNNLMMYDLVEAICMFKLWPAEQTLAKLINSTANGRMANFNVAREHMAILQCLHEFLENNQLEIARITYPTDEMAAYFFSANLAATEAFMCKATYLVYVKPQHQMTDTGGEFPI